MIKALPKLVFVHVPKSAGVAFYNILLQSGMGGGDVFVDKFQQKVAPDDPRQLVVGHIPASRYLDSGRELVTWLRHPLPRTVSHCRFYGGGDPADWAKNNPNYVTTRHIDIPLRRFSFVGITERFDEGLSLFERIFGVTLNKAPLLPEQANSGGPHPKLSERQRQGILAHSQADLALYEQAQRRFEGDLGWA